MLPNRAGMDVEDLLKIILVLIIVWIAVDIVLDVLQFAFGGLSSIVGILIVVLIVAYFLDYI
jgi:F0F1-type ATP synthase assembly protein I